MSDEFGQLIRGLHAVGDTVVSTDTHMAALAKDASNNYAFLELTANGLKVDVQTIGSVTVTATSLDIRPIDYATDDIAIMGATGNQLAVNADGSINVVAATSSPDSVYVYGSVTLVKDTIGTVVTTAPGATQYFSAVMVSGAGLCEWILQFGTTGAEATIMSFWTTPASPTYYVDLPDYIEVTATETIRVRATNREKGGSTGSDFTGHATLIRKV